jgi:hypothetical protein
MNIFDDKVNKLLKLKDDLEKKISREDKKKIINYLINDLKVEYAKCDEQILFVLSNLNDEKIDKLRKITDKCLN